MNPEDPNAYWDRVLRQAYPSAFEPTAPAPRHPSGLTPGEAFADRQAQVDAMRDPRYAKDPAYRQAVAERTLGTIQTRARFG